MSDDAPLLKRLARFYLAYWLIDPNWPTTSPLRIRRYDELMDAYAAVTDDDIDVMKRLFPDDWVLPKGAQ